MQSENIFILKPTTAEQIEALKNFISKFNIKFEITLPQKGYDVEFVEKINKSKKEIEDGKYVSVEKKDLKDLLGL